MRSDRQCAACLLVVNINFFDKSIENEFDISCFELILQSDPMLFSLKSNDVMETNI